VVEKFPKILLGESEVEATPGGKFDHSTLRNVLFTHGSSIFSTKIKCKPDRRHKKGFG
jgi:hypothetical protein